MTIDNHTKAARAYAEQACYQDENIPIAEAGFRAGWKAARDYLAAQEPTFDEIALAGRAMRDQAPDDAPDWPDWVWARFARQGLSAARAARRDEETR